MNTSEQQTILTLCLMAAFADGTKHDTERAQLKRLGEKFPQAAGDLAQLYHRVLVEKPSVADVARTLTTPEARQLAYEMVVCVCDADEILNQAEKEFLAELRRSLGMDSGAAASIEQDAGALAAVPVGEDGAAPPKSDIEANRMILNYAILNGALELLPDTLATMTIVPLQMKMVYRLGKRHGYELDRHHIKELLGAAGLGLTSQVVEGYARKLLGGLMGRLGAGGTIRRVGDQVASSAISFATTYALGQLALRYYAGGRTLSAIQLRDQFHTLLCEAKSLHSRYAPEIQSKAGGLNPKQLLHLLRQPLSS